MTHSTWKSLSIEIWVETQEERDLGSLMPWEKSEHTTRVMETVELCGGDVVVCWAVRCWSYVEEWDRSVRCWSYMTDEKDQWDVGAMWQMRKISEMLELCDHDVVVCRAGGSQGQWNLRPSGWGEQAAHTQTWTLHLRSARSQQEPLQAECQFTSVQRLVFPVLSCDLFVHVDAK